MKDLMGHSSLAWNPNKKEGAYAGAVYDHTLEHSAALKKVIIKRT